MPIEAISGLTGLQPVTGAAKTASGDGEFADILSDAIAQTDSTDAATQADTVGLLTGSTDDMAGTVVNLEKADVALRLTIQVRNKVIDAYNEVMRMQL
jgi:flagellar hook-basal body complex protein FliE